MKVGFPSKFSLNKIHENERTKFVHFRSQFSRISMYFWRNFRLHFCEIFVQFSFDKNQKFSISYQEDCIFANKKDLKGKVKHEHEHGRKHEHDNKFRESFERISQKWTNIFVFGHIFVGGTKTLTESWIKSTSEAKEKNLNILFKVSLSFSEKNVAYVSPRYLRQKNTLKI